LVFNFNKKSHKDLQEQNLSDNLPKEGDDFKIDQEEEELIITKEKSLKINNINMK